MIISGLFEQIPDLSAMVKKLSLAGDVSDRCTWSYGYDNCFFHRHMREHWAKTEFRNLRLGAWIIVAVAALVVFLATIVVIKSISVT